MTFVGLTIFINFTALSSDAFKVRNAKLCHLQLLVQYASMTARTKNTLKCSKRNITDILNVKLSEPRSPPLDKVYILSNHC